MPSCFAPGCKSGNRGQKARMFKPSKGVAAEWISILWKLRSDKRFDPAKDSHRLCSLHFQESEIIKEDTFLINTETVSNPRKNWTLKEGTIPSIFPNIPSYLQPKVVTKRRELKRKCVSKPNTIAKKTCADNVTCDNSQELPIQQYNWWNNYIAGGSWVLECELAPNHVSLMQIAYTNDIPHIDRALSICKTTGKWKSAVELQDVTSYLQRTCPTLPDQISSPQEATTVVYELGLVSLCGGIPGFADIQPFGIAHKKLDRWFSRNCTSIGFTKLCENCKMLYPLLQDKSYRHVTPVLNSNSSKTNQSQEIGYYKRQIAKYKGRRNRDKENISELRFSVNLKDKSRIETALRNLTLPSNMKTSILHCLQLAKRKSAKGFRYSMDWLLECLLIKIKSPASYTHLREAKLLPLPHPSTLRRLISGQKCDFGFNDLSLNAIKEEFRNLDRRDRQGVLVFDEVQLRESIEYNKREMKFVGYVDFSENSDNTVTKSDKGKLANHALVLMYRPFNNSWVQPVGVFATRNAAKGNILQKLILSAILKLEDVGAEVLCVTCDGSKPNKSFWKLMGISGYTDDVTNKIPHPADASRQLFFGSDVPHLFKCSRNNFLKYNEISFLGKTAKFQYYERLFEAEQRRSCGLRKCPKLTSSHIRPNNFEKMIVSHATQLFSRTVATGLKFYRTMGYGDFYGSEATEELTQTLNDVFDCLNARYRSQGIIPGSEKFQVLAAFLKTLAVEIRRCDEKGGPKTFASKETIAAMRVTIASTLEIIEYLVFNLKYEYVLTAKMNQDCLEVKFFGLIRAAGGREDHPTVNNFIQLYRLLTIYTPAKRAVRGNISEDEEVTVLCNFTSYLEDSRKSKDMEVAIKRQEHRDSLYQRLLHMDQALAIDLDNSTLDDTDKNIVYHVCGFVCHKAIKLVKCSDCVSSIITDKCDEMVATMTNILNRGPLSYPSPAFFKVMLCGVEEKIQKLIKESYLYGDIILECIKNIADVDITSIGCKISGHVYDMLCILIPYYITMRINFYARSVNADLGRGKSTKNKRKESKLVS